MGLYLKKAISLFVNKVCSILFIPYELVLYLGGLIKLIFTSDREFPVVGLIPIIGNNHMEAGGIDRHYYLQDIYMARKVRENMPSHHYDIGSRVDGFISHLLCDNIKVTMIDIRPLPVKVEGLSFIQGDATNLEQLDSNTIDSLSTLHAVEHFGLSRYGDKIDSNASKKAISAIQRVLKKGGYLYFSVPISNRNGIVYNSHRVFRPNYIREHFGEMELVSFAYIHDYKINEYFGEEAEKVISDNNFNEYDCGMFVFRKK